MDEAPVILSATVSVSPSEGKEEKKTSIAAGTETTVGTTAKDMDLSEWEDEKVEPLLSENKGRFVLFPIQYTRIWKMYKKHEAAFWTCESVGVEEDTKEWPVVAPNAQQVVKVILALLIDGGGAAALHMAERLLEAFQVPEIRAFYSMQIAMKNVHHETYSLLMHTYVPDTSESERLVASVATLHVIQAEKEWATKWMHSSVPVIEQVVAFAALERIIRAGALCIVLWLKKRGTRLSVLFRCYIRISRDKELQGDFACLLYGLFRTKLSQKRVEEIVKEAVEKEILVIRQVMATDLVGMSATLLSAYIRFLADQLVDSLGHEKIYRTKNPFEWVDTLSFQGRTADLHKIIARHTYRRNSIEGIRESYSSRDIKCSSREWTTEAAF